MFVASPQDENKRCNKASRVQFELQLNQHHQPTLKDCSMNGSYVNHLLIGKDNWVLLQHLDLISILQEDLVMFQFLDNRTLLSKGYPVRITAKYLIGPKIGSGGFSTVNKGFEKGSNLAVALKVLSKPKWWGETMAVIKEVELVRGLHHPCITRVLDVEETSYQVVIVMELAPGGDLMSRLLQEKREGTFCEQTVKFRFYQIVHAVGYLHSVRICHRDLKLANILLMEEGSRSLLKVCDFGVSKRWSDTTLLSTCVGTPNFVAPEVLRASNQRSGDLVTYSYTSKADCWSLGVILYMLLGREPPFVHNLNKGQILGHQVMRGTYRDMQGGFWESVSNPAKNLISRLLVVKPGLRPSAPAILRHTWFEDDPVVCMEAREVMARYERAADQRSGRVVEKSEHYSALRRNERLCKRNLADGEVEALSLASSRTKRRRRRNSDVVPTSNHVLGLNGGARKKVVKRRRKSGL